MNTKIIQKAKINIIAKKLHTLIESPVPRSFRTFSIYCDFSAAADGGQRSRRCLSTSLPRRNSKMKATKVVFSLAEALLLIERGKKNAALAAFDLNGIGGAGGYCLPVQTVTGI